MKETHIIESVSLQSFTISAFLNRFNNGHWIRIYYQFPSKVLPVQFFSTGSAMAQAMAAIPSYTPMLPDPDMNEKNLNIYLHQLLKGGYGLIR